MSRVYVLRKTFEGYSAGTRVSYDPKYQEFYIFDTQIPKELVVKRRQRTIMIER